MDISKVVKITDAAVIKAQGYAGEDLAKDGIISQMRIARGALESLLQALLLKDKTNGRCEKVSLISHKHTICCECAGSMLLYEARLSDNIYRKKGLLSASREFIIHGMHKAPRCSQLHYLNALMRVELAKLETKSQKKYGHLNIAFRYLTLEDRNREVESNAWKRSTRLVNAYLKQLEDNDNDLFSKQIVSLEFLNAHKVYFLNQKRNTKSDTSSKEEEEETEYLLHSPHEHSFSEQSPREIERRRRRKELSASGVRYSMSPGDISALQKRMQAIKRKVECKTSSPIKGTINKSRETQEYIDDNKVENNRNLKHKKPNANSPKYSSLKERLEDKNKSTSYSDPSHLYLRKQRREYELKRQHDKVRIERKTKPSNPCSNKNQVRKHSRTFTSTPSSGRGHKTMKPECHKKSNDKPQSHLAKKTTASKKKSQCLERNNNQIGPNTEKKIDTPSSELQNRNRQHGFKEFVARQQQAGQYSGTSSSSSTPFVQIFEPKRGRKLFAEKEPGELEQNTLGRSNSMYSSPQVNSKLKYQPKQTKSTESLRSFLAAKRTKEMQNLKSESPTPYIQIFESKYSKSSIESKEPTENTEILDELDEKEFEKRLKLSPRKSIEMGNQSQISCNSRELGSSQEKHISDALTNQDEIDASTIDRQFNHCQEKYSSEDDIHVSTTGSISMNISLTVQGQDAQCDTILDEKDTMNNITGLVENRENDTIDVENKNISEFATKDNSGVSIGSSEANLEPNVSDNDIKSDFVEVLSKRDDLNAESLHASVLVDGKVSEENQSYRSKALSVMERKRSSMLEGEHSQCNESLSKRRSLLSGIGSFLPRMNAGKTKKSNKSESNIIVSAQENGVDYSNLPTDLDNLDNKSQSTGRSVKVSSKSKRRSRNSLRRKASLSAFFK